MVNIENFINELKIRNEDALNFIIDCYGNLLFQISYKYLKSSELSKECINDVLLKVWDSIEQYDPKKSSFSNWISSITKYTAIDILKKEKKYYKNSYLNENNNLDYNNLEENYISRNELIELVQSINSFKKIDKEIFLLRFFFNERYRYYSKRIKHDTKCNKFKNTKSKKKIKNT